MSDLLKKVIPHVRKYDCCFNFYRERSLRKGRDAMASVTAAFARAMARAVGLTMTDDGRLLSADGSVQYVCPTDGERVPGEVFFDLIEWIRTRQADEAELVFAYAQVVKPDDLGVLGLAMKTAPTLGESLKRVERYFRLVTDSAVYLLEETGDNAVFSIEAKTAPHPCLQLRNECALADLAINMQHLVGGMLRLQNVAFRHSCRSDPDRYAAFFDCPVEFGGQRDAITMERSMLALPNRLGDRSVSDFMTAHLDTELGKLSSEGSLAGELLKRLSRALREGVPPAAAIARDMGLSERTLYRRLADEGMTYRDVLRQAQTKLAQELLRQSDCSIAEIAFLTGFSEQSTFTRAFKRWVGQPPARFRQQALHA
jgi:AraC-like DNA-binding protein